MCRFKEAFLPRAFIIFVSLIRSIRCDSFSNAREGESVMLQFPYPCISTKITLQYGNRLPFHNSANPFILESNPDQSERFTVEKTNEEDHCFLQLRIDPVTRDDGGTYILLTYNGDYITRVGLSVDFLPGVAHCSFGGSNDYTGDWIKLHCEASCGSVSVGQIQCYQGGTQMPQLDAPSENDNSLQQTILVQQNRHHVYCCSSQLIEPKDRCDCNDSVWDPLSQGEVHNPGDPCPATAHAPTAPLTTSYHQDHTSSNMRAIIPTKGEIKEETYPTKKYVIVLTVAFAMMMILLIVYIMYLMQSNSMRHRSNAMKNKYSSLLLQF